MADVTDAVVKPTIRERMKAAVLFAATPQVIASLSLIAGLGLAVAGIYILSGIGWALMAGALPLLFLSGVLIRGLISGR